MSDSKSTPSNVFNVETVRALVELMKQHDLSEVDLREGDQKISLKRGSQAPIYAAPAPMPVAPMQQAAVPVSVAAPAAGGGETAAPSDSHLVAIKSPMVGTFYLRPKPESDPFVRVGDHVSDDTVVCIIEAMKVFNDIKAEISGKVVKVLVKNEEPVEFGQPMFMVDPQG
ncbi:acetyl-CoA carboxylase biotin carboxyl carrier protein [Blastopirellula marina]|uniref:Biotin carboxyl carrier protein of acetyl-CoA carboxylase n=1 Tax=Blastopirellula marina TaxID=124 RepID=A0A2S8F699_9BACT|nr:acetyl-CoA carboxylase biotin carboxyl carrier protein [Blastopirellula marina]PQO27689.1 acetyl-CoA carboxylase biotin carboxyl carrier protein [Blastopirellula marina]PTL41428.1 acetyl-CoA carboxylase biotin carboxyl carrier protein [Blastopirellula marina]